MALSSEMDNYTGAQPTQPKIIPPHSEGCISPQNCQYWNGIVCELEECPFKIDKTIVAVNGFNADGTPNIQGSLRRCFICDNNFMGFIGAVPVCPTCMERIKYVIATPHCPGCGAAVSTPHSLCSSCKNAYLRG